MSPVKIASKDEGNLKNVKTYLENGEYRNAAIQWYLLLDKANSTVNWCKKYNDKLRDNVESDLEWDKKYGDMKVEIPNVIDTVIELGMQMSREVFGNIMEISQTLYYNDYEKMKYLSLFLNTYSDAVMLKIKRMGHEGVYASLEELQENVSEMQEMSSVVKMFSVNPPKIREFVEDKNK